jgi:Flp pilus assembly protein TadD
MAETTSTRPAEQTLDRIVEQVTGAMRALNLNDAYRIAQSAIDSGLEHPLLLKVQGLWLQENGKYQDALRAFHHARTLAPEDPMILNGIAGTLSAQGENDAALKILDVALEMAPDIATTSYLRGWCFDALGDAKNARKAYERTLSLRPNHTQAMAGLAAVAARVGDFDAAKANAERALTFDLREPTATVALAMAEISGGHPAVAETRLGKLLQSPISGKARALALSVLGDALDAQDRAKDAFEAYESGNAALRAVQQDFAPPPNAVVQSLLDLAANLKATSGQWSAAVAKRPAQAAQTHIFLVDFPGSETTLLEHVLASNPHVIVLGEADPLREAAQAYLVGPDAIADLLSASESELDAVREIYWRSVQAKIGDRELSVFVDKHPLNMTKLPLIARLFPDARVLFAIRDPRDVVFSSFRRHFQTRAFTFELLTLDGAARLYDATMRIGEWSRENLPLACHSHSYEKMVAAFSDQIDAVCKFVGIGWTDSMRDFAKSAAERDVASLSVPQVKRGLYAEGVGRWRHYAAQLEPVMPILAPWIKKFDYPQS